MVGLTFCILCTVIELKIVFFGNIMNKKMFQMKNLIRRFIHLQASNKIIV